MELNINVIHYTYNLNPASEYLLTAWREMGYTTESK